MNARRAVALPTVLFALTMSSALAVGGVYVARRMAQAARLEQRAGLLLPSAESALIESLAQWDSVGRAQQPVGDVVLLGTQSDGVIETSVWVTRLTHTEYWTVAESVSAVPPMLRRRIGLVVHVPSGYPTALSVRPWSDLP